MSKYKPPKTSASKEVKKLKRPPFAKDLFWGKFDTEVLGYPEVLNVEQLETLESMAEQVNKFFDESVDSKKIDAESKIPKETLDGLKALGLFGQQIPTEYGGLGLNATEYSRLAEFIAKDPSISVTLSAHQAIGLKVKLLIIITCISF